MDLAVVIVIVVAVSLAAVVFIRRGGATLSGAEAKSLVDEGATLLDVRTAAEYGAHHLEGAINIPLQQLPSRLQEMGSSDSTIVVYCQSGMRSASAKQLLEKNGFTSVRNLGSINRWPA